MNNPNEFFIEMGKRIMNCRKSLNISQEELAERADLSVQAISTAERGTKALRPDNLLKVSRALGVSTDYLLSGEANGKHIPFLEDKLKDLSEKQINAISSIVSTCLDLCNPE